MAQVIDASWIAMPRVQFLGTGNAFSPHGRMHALVLIDGKILVDAPPTLLPQLRRVGDQVTKSNIYCLHIGTQIICSDFHSLSSRERWFECYRFSECLSKTKGRDSFEPQSYWFPGSLNDVLNDDINWVENESGELQNSEWSYERFRVIHTPETDPHGYLLTHRVDSNYYIVATLGLVKR